MDLSALLFLLKKNLAVLALPPAAPMLLIATGLMLLTRARKLGLTLAWSGLGLYFVLSTPYTVGWLLRPLEDVPTVSAEAASTAQAIVILGGGKRTIAPEYGGETINRLTLERVRYGARLARATDLPVLVSGGLARDGLSEAELMRESLLTDFGVTATWVESASRDTRENARFSAERLREAGIGRILLVSHAVHIPRARAEFERHGIDVIPAPTAWFSHPSEEGAERGGRGIPDLRPGANAAYAGWLAAHEWLGRIAYRLVTPASPAPPRTSGDTATEAN